MSTACKAFTDRTGAHTCNRCGYQWDADDTAPVCKTWQTIESEKRRHGNEVLKHIREDLEK